MVRARPRREAGWCALLALLALAAAFLAAIGRATTAATVAVGVGIVALGLGVWRGSRRARPAQHYRRRPMTRADWSLIAAVALAPVVLVGHLGRRQRHARLVREPVAVAALRSPRRDRVLPLLAPLVRRPVAAPWRTRTLRRVPADLGIAT